jgi:hypothetical protein
LFFMTTHADRILEFVRRFPGRDDDEISRSLKISPRQSVNIVCRALERRGYLKRKPSLNGKICNYPPGGVKPATQGARPASTTAEQRPPLTTDLLLASGFKQAADWMTVDPLRLQASAALPKERGVYAFVSDNRAQYVGLATMGVAKRLYFYSRPSITQRTSLRLNSILLEALATGRSVSIYVAHPPDLTWNGLPVSGDAGLELGLIQQFELPWNKRGVR